MKKNVREFDIDIVVLLKTWVSKSEVDLTIAQIRFSFSYQVKAKGFVGGIWAL